MRLIQTNLENAAQVFSPDIFSIGCSHRDCKALENETIDLHLTKTQSGEELGTCGTLNPIQIECLSRITVCYEGGCWNV